MVNRGHVYCALVTPNGAHIHPFTHYREAALRHGAAMSTGSKLGSNVVLKDIWSPGLINELTTLGMGDAHDVMPK